jgi:hypothetical protein
VDAVDTPPKRSAGGLADCLNQIQTGIQLKRVSRPTRLTSCSSQNKTLEVTKTYLALSFRLRKVPKNLPPPTQWMDLPEH